MKRLQLLSALFVLAWVCAVGAPSAEAPAHSENKSKPRQIMGPDESLWAVFIKGGWCMWPILGCSIIGLAFYFERAVELRRKKHAPPGFEKDVVHLVDSRGVDAGLARCLDKQSSLSRILYAALLRYGSSRQEMESAVQDEGSRLLYDLRRNCRVIGLMSSTAPLWGLLGTVLGLIQAFDEVAVSGGQAMGRTEQLAEGVGVALLTTAFGLIVAIPLTLFFSQVKGKADDLVREIEERAVDAIVTLDRKARKSIRLIEDLEENLETKEMTAARPAPDLDAEFKDDDLEKAIKTSVTTPAHLLIVTPAAGTTPLPAAPSVSGSTEPQPPRLIPKRPAEPKTK